MAPLSRKFSRGQWTKQSSGLLSGFCFFGHGLDDPPKIDFQSEAHAKDGVERWFANSSFHVADHLLGKSGTLGYRAHGKILPQSLIFESLSDGGAERLDCGILEHSFNLRGKRIDKESNYSEGLPMLIRQIFLGLRAKANAPIPPRIFSTRNGAQRVGI